MSSVSLVEKVAKSCQKLPLSLVLVVPFVLQTVGAVGLVGYLSYRSGQQSVTDLSERLIAEVSDRTTLYLQETLSTPHRINQLNADAIRLGTLPGFETQNTTLLERTFLAQIRRFPNISTIAIANERGGMAGAGQGDRGEQTVVYRTAQFARGVFTNSFVDAEGNTIRTDTVAPDFDARKRPWYQKPALAGEATWSPIYQYIANGTLLGISAGQPIYDATGKLRGVLATDITLGRINQFLSELQISHSGQVFILERNGLLVGTSSQQPLFVTRQSNGEAVTTRIQAINSGDPLIRATSEAILEELGSWQQIASAQKLSISILGDRLLVKITPYRDEMGLDWLIITTIPQSDFMGVINANHTRTLLLCGATLLAAVGFGMLTSRWIARPIQQLNRVAQSITEGHLDQNFYVGGVAEVSHLSESLKQMTEQLQASLAARQTGERTLFTLLNSVPVGVSVFDVKGQIVLLNQVGVSLLDQQSSVNLTSDEIAQKFRAFVVGSQQPYPTDKLPIVRGLKGEPSLIDDLEIEINDRRIPLEIRTTPVHDDDGKVLYVVSAFQDITERRQAERLWEHYYRDLERQVAERTEELSQVRNLREAIFNQSTDAIFLVESPPASRILDCNWRGMELFEVDCKEDLIGIQVNTLQKQEFTPEELQKIAVDLQQQGFWSREIEYVTRKGKVFWGNLAAKTIEVGGAVMQLVRLTDISDRKQTEERLRRTEQWLQQYSRQSPGSIYTLVQEPDGHLWLEFTSSAVESIHEITQEQAVANIHLILDQMHPDDRPGYEEAVARSIENMEVFSYEWRITTPSGKLKWLQGNSQPERRSNGAIAWHGVIQDISDRKRQEAERKQAESALQQSEERFRSAFDDAAVGMSIVSSDGQFLQVNQALCELLGYTETELLQRSFQEVTHPEDLEKDLVQVRQLLAGKTRSYQIEKRNLHKQGHIVWISLNASVVRDSDGTPLYFISQVQDVSNRHELDRIKDEFISIVSHELRTPLTAIRGSLGILETGVLDNRPERAKHMLQVAVNNSERLVRLVNDILDLERLESGKVELVKEECEVADLLQQAAEAMQAIADKDSITLTVLPIQTKVWAAPDAILQTLTNLLSNAIKFSPASSVIQLSAQVKSVDELISNIHQENGRFAIPLSFQTSLPSHSVVFAVKDQGRGIPEDKLEDIFNRFQQVDASDSRQKGGTGLGLAICKSIVQQHGGEIWVESILGKGSTFYFTLPTAPNHPTVG